LDTVAHRVVFFGHIAEQKLRARLLQRQASQDLIKSVDLDEMESSIHSKLLPVSMPIIVETKSREILWLSVSEMPAKGPMAQASVKKYGKRKDHRKMHGILVLNTIKPAAVERVIVQTDYKRDYPTWIAETLPLAKHQPTKGRRGCVVGQGELKKIGHDPLFSFNHTAAMFRANVNRLFRRTWCTSKRLDRLYLHMMIYAQFHNEVLVPLAEKRRKRRESKRLAAA
jgi:hypothetical protein